MNFISQKLEPLFEWLDTLNKRERTIVIGGAICFILIMFYLLLWEPITSRYQQQQQQLTSQRQLLQWMKDAASDIQEINAAGGNFAARFSNQSISSLADRSANTSGVKPYINKIEQSKTGVKVTLKNASFDNIIKWLADLSNKYNIQATKIKVEKSEISGAVDADITLERNT